MLEKLNNCKPTDGEKSININTLQKKKKVYIPL